MKYIISILFLMAMSGCSHAYLVDKRQCIDIGPDYLSCKEVHKVK